MVVYPAGYCINSSKVYCKLKIDVIEKNYTDCINSSKVYCKWLWRCYQCKNEDVLIVAKCIVNFYYI